MKVLLKKDVETLGYAGEIHEVTTGYGRNYLIPRGLAEKATPGALKAADSWRKRAEARRAEVRKEHELLVQRINGVTLDFTAKAGEQGKLYGSITTAAIADQLNAVLGTELDRRKVDTPPLRHVGDHHVSVVLSHEHKARLLVRIHPESGEEAKVETAIAQMPVYDQEFDDEADFDEWEELDSEELR
jgi:large subunit ribosomal protein L9